MRQKLVALFLSALTILAIAPASLSAYTPTPGARDREFRGDFKGFPEVLHITNVHINIRRGDHTEPLPREYIDYVTKEIEEKLSRIKDKYPYTALSTIIYKPSLLIDVDYYVGDFPYEYSIKAKFYGGTSLFEKQLVKGKDWDNNKHYIALDVKELQGDIPFFLNQVIDEFIKQFLFVTI